MNRWDVLYGFACFYVAFWTTIGVVVLGSLIRARHRTIIKRIEDTALRLLGFEEITDSTEEDNDGSSV